MLRIYKVSILNEEVLIRARSRRAAMWFAMNRSVKVTVASQEDLASMISRGAVVNNADGTGGDAQ